MNRPISPYIGVGLPQNKNIDVLDIVSGISGYSIKEITSGSKKGNLSDARTLAAMVFLKQGLTLQQTANNLGLLNHSTIVTQKQKFATMATNKHDILYQWAMQLKEKHLIDLGVKTIAQPVANTRNYHK